MQTIFLRDTYRCHIGEKRVKYSRFNEFICCLFDHKMTQTGSTTDDKTGIVLSSYEQCENCGIRIVDESGYIELDNLKYGVAIKEIQE